MEVTFNRNVIVPQPDDDVSSGINTLLMQLRGHQSLTNVQLSLELLHAAGQDDLAALVEAPALVEVVVPLLIEEEIFALWRVA